MALVGGVFGGVNTAAFQQLQAFLAVARHRSFSGAARELGVTRSAVSQAVRQLEEQLRVVLLARTTRSVSLTDAGRRLLDGAGPALGQALATMTEVSAQPGEAVGRVRLSVPRPAVPFVIDRCCLRFARVTRASKSRSPSRTASSTSWPKATTRACGSLT